jgi:biopolymer transport protein ExbD
MATPRQRRAGLRRSRDKGVKLNITSMMDMFTIILVFLLKSYSSEGQLVTPAEKLLLPNSIVKKAPHGGLELKVSSKVIMIEDQVMFEGKQIDDIMQDTQYLIRPMYEKLAKYAREARATAETYKQEFKGTVIIQGDKEIPYNLLVKIMYTCGQAGYPSINLIVYKKE